MNKEWQNIYSVNDGRLLIEYRRREIIRDGKLIGYHVYQVGTGFLGTDKFMGYEWYE